MSEALKVVVSGAGAVGLTAAVLLVRGHGQLPIRITLVDAIEPAAFSIEDDVALRVSALSAGSLALLSAIGVREGLRVRECPYRDMRVWDAPGDPFGPEALHFSAAEMALPELGFIVEDALLRQVLLDSLRESDVELRFGSRIAGIETGPARTHIELANGERLQADLLIGADGARSAVRDAFGIDTEGWQYAQAALVTHLRPANDHRHTAWQRFLDGGPLALLPLADGRVSIVWSTAPEHARELLDADDAAFASQVTEASDFVLGQLTPAAPRASFPLRAQHARQYVARGMALVGDAAHTVHPLAGQGANLGIADAAVLARVIADALAAGEHPTDLPVLRRYERERRGANAAMLYLTDGLNRLFSTDSTLLGALRGSGMRLFNRSGPLKRRAMRVALGLGSGPPAAGLDG